jgi:CrcB protein
MRRRTGGRSHQPKRFRGDFIPESSIEPMLAKRAFLSNVPALPGGWRRRLGAVITYFWIALGSALGGVARYACSNLAVAWLGPSFPWGTLAINVLGSFVIGFFATLTGPDGRLLVAGDARQFVMVGLCGGYTTFSSFSFQTLTLVQDGEIARAGLNVGGSVVLCLLSVWLGYVSAAALNAVKGS